MFERQWLNDWRVKVYRDSIGACGFSELIKHCLIHEGVNFTEQMIFKSEEGCMVN